MTTPQSKLKRYRIVVKNPYNGEAFFVLFIEAASMKEAKAKARQDIVIEAESTDRWPDADVSGIAVRRS